MYHDFPTSYEDLIDNAKLSFNRKEELEKIFNDALDNQTYEDWQWAVRETHLQLLGEKQ